jgi:hypothetical protein
MKSPLSMFTPDSGFLISTKWTLWDTVIEGIHLHHTTLDLTSYLFEEFSTLCEYIGTKSILSIIRKLYCLLYRRECDDREYRTKYLFSPDCHIWSDIAEDSRRYIGSLESYWDIELSEYHSSFFEGITILSLDSYSLTLRNYWSDISSFECGISDFLGK